MSVISRTALAVISNPGFEPGAVPSFDGGGFLPNSVANLQLWLDAADTSATNITQSGGSVSAWADKSGNGNNGTQGTGAAQPTTNATTQNSKNVLDFDGGDNIILPSAVFTIPGAANTTFVVSKRNVDSGVQVALGMLDGGGFNFEYALFYGAAGEVNFRNDNGVDGAVTVGSITTTNFNILQTSFNGTTGLSISVNGATATTNTGGAVSAGVDSAGVGGVASSLKLTGSIAEILIYNRSLSTTEILSVNTYLSNKWGVTLA